MDYYNDGSSDKAPLYPFLLKANLGKIEITLLNSDSWLLAPLCLLIHLNPVVFLLAGA
jgi:hypothetical protein